jgi:hypothetical protein
VVRAIRLNAFEVGIHPLFYAIRSNHFVKRDSPPRIMVHTARWMYL